MADFQQLAPDASFHFLCHADIACFNQCCRDLNQYLTPYDIVRLKNRLRLDSTQFLKQYTVSHVGPRSGLPMVSLRMVAREGLRCPFVTTSGCTVYEDRPGACRTYPLGRMAVRQQGQDHCKESYFLIKEPHCRGFEESTTWTIDAWKNNQQIHTYNTMNDLMMDLVTLNNRRNKKKLTPDEAAVFFLACYDLDRFKGVALRKGLLAGERTKAALDDDTALMCFAIDWVKDQLFGVCEGDTQKTVTCLGGIYGAKR